MLDDLLLAASLRATRPSLVVFDGDESFILELIEARYYELVSATDAERLIVQRLYRLLRSAADFRCVAA
jgi:hypothetical protein